MKETGLCATTRVGTTKKQKRERERDMAQYCVKGVMILVVPTDPRTPTSEHGPTV